MTKEEGNPVQTGTNRGSPTRQTMEARLRKKNVPDRLRKTIHFREMGGGGREKKKEKILGLCALTPEWSRAGTPRRQNYEGKKKGGRESTDFVPMGDSFAQGKTTGRIPIKKPLNFNPGNRDRGTLEAHQLVGRDKRGNSRQTLLKI